MMRGREAHDDRTEPQGGEGWMHLEDGRMDPDVHDQRKKLAKRVSSNQH